MSALRYNVTVLGGGGQHHHQFEQPQQFWPQVMKPSANVTSLLSTVARNRKEHFDLVAAIEHAGHCEIDVQAMQGIIDSEYHGRLELTAEEAQRVLLAVAKPKRE